MDRSASGDQVAALAIAEKGAAVVGTVGLALYGIVRVAYDAFYGRLGSSAEEVGLNYIAIITQAALALLGICVSAAVLGTTTALAVWPDLRVTVHRRFVADAGTRAAQPSPPPSPLVLVQILGVTLAGYLALVAVYDLGLIADVVEGGAWRGVLLGLLLPVLLAFVVTMGFRRRHRRLPKWSLPVWALVLVLVGTLPALTISSLVGDHAARKVENGAELQHRSWLPWLPGPGAFGFEAKWVSVSWVGGEGPDELSDATRFIYLGMADGQAVLYCPRQRGVTRLPAGNVVVMPPVQTHKRCG